MCGCCNDIKHSFLVHKIFIPLTILFNIGLTVYFIISNAQNYEKYQNRALYIVYHIPNTTSDFYIIRANETNIFNCSSNALFTFDVTTVYENIISKHGTRNALFISVYWLSTIVATIINLFGIFLVIRSHCITDDSDYEDDSHGKWSITLMSAIGSQFLQKGAFVFPTYFIGIFDYTQLCLPHHTKESLFILHHTYIGVVISLCGMVYLVIWTWACWDTQRNDYDDSPTCIKYIKVLTCHNSVVSLAVFFLLCLVVILIGVYGIFVWITSLMEFLLTTKAVLICFNFVLGVLHDIIKHCRSY